MYTIKCKNKPLKPARISAKLAYPFSALLLMLVGEHALAAPTALGPHLPTASAQGAIGVGIIEDIVRFKANEIIDETNVDLEAKGEDTRVSLESLSFWNPYRLATEKVNQPNSFFVRVPFLLTVHASIPYVGDRDIAVPIDVDLTCDGWQNPGGGLVMARGVAGPPSIEGGSILEDVITIRDDVDSRVRAAFNTPAPFSQMLGAAMCVSLGTRIGPTTELSEVIWDRPARSLPGGSVVAVPTIEVTYVKLRRLAARSLHGGILYQPLENILLRTYANYSYAQKYLSMVEGQELLLNLPPVSFDARKFDNLVVLGNIDQETFEAPDDTGWSAFSRLSFFGAGTHTVMVPKWYIMQPQQIPGGGMTKPTRIPVDAYELTFTVRYLNAPLKINGTFTSDGGGTGGTLEPVGGTTIGGTFETAPKTRLSPRGREYPAIE